MSRPSPLQNRVLPTGEIIADPARGIFTGNRGILQFENGQLGTSRWKHQHWIICTLTHPKGRYHGPMPKHAWTPLFFLDEAVALAAGHRPCAYCRPKAYAQYKSLWIERFGTAGHSEIDKSLHKNRVGRGRSQIRHQADLASLPVGAIIRWQDQTFLVREGCLLPYSPNGYGTEVPRGTGVVEVLTPKPSLAILEAGYRPKLHPSAHTCG
ncbi:hypothetical protein O2N63_08360 [Aliiroseovarius sp. KMU-50]|uniref:Uncharacterized protein n=1 Tax=Aliiroseovarius salicola TaxID=3009082 RepID=A0ABT4W0W5_9RHOB|nr:hypothetical protein [Aliiroseovarius sp. KMU-50]MDA5094101.1 hypothetical protein [Aliiroseovarius sp. KMU-50]